VRAVELADPRKLAQDQPVKVAGLAHMRQRPATAQGIIFMTLEDESGIANLVVHPSTFERHRAEARHGVALFIEGRVDRSDAVVHVIVRRFESLDERARVGLGVAGHPLIIDPVLVSGPIQGPPGNMRRPSQ
jgi:DNA polymerase III alpha subunit